MSENKFSGPEALARCVPMSRLQSVLSGKWKILILWYVAFYRVQRFGQLLRRLDGITQSTLTKQLRELEADGFLRREVFPEVPPRVEYTLTELGEGFFRVHKGYLINLSHVESYTRTEVLLRGGTQAPISKYKYRDFVRAYLRFLRREAAL